MSWSAQPERRLMMSRKRKAWAETVGRRPHQLRVFERTPGGRIYVRWWDSDARSYVKRSLGHRDRQRALAEAHRLHAEMMDGATSIRDGKATLGVIFPAYLRHRSPEKGEHEQAADKRRVELWTRVLGGEDRDPSTISLREWEAVIRDRREGLIDAKGRRVARKRDRRPVRDRTLQADCTWLGAVFRWAERWRTDNGYLMQANPIRGFRIPREKNPRRGIATAERFEATMKKAGQVHPFLIVMLTLANETGRRIGAIRRLRYSDLHLNSRPGSITWREDADKQGLRWERIPISRKARRALDRQLRACPGIGDAYLFPAPRGVGPVSKRTAYDWLKAAEKKANVEALPGRAWHAYRARFATEMVDVPDRVVAKLGGWKSTATLDIYQQPGEDVMLEALSRRRQLRDRASR